MILGVVFKVQETNSYTDKYCRYIGWVMSVDKLRIYSNYDFI